jgi:hypothetical protein
MTDTINSYFEEEEDPELDADDVVGIEPCCVEDPEIIEDMGIKCEYIIKDGYWWCSTHNCHA